MIEEEAGCCRGFLRPHRSVVNGFDQDKTDITGSTGRVKPLVPPCFAGALGYRYQEQEQEHQHQHRRLRNRQPRGGPVLDMDPASSRR